MGIALDILNQKTAVAVGPHPLTTFKSQLPAPTPSKNPHPLSYFKSQLSTGPAIGTAPPHPLTTFKSTAPSPAAANNTPVKAPAASPPAAAAPLAEAPAKDPTPAPAASDAIGASEGPTIHEAPKTEGHFGARAALLARRPAMMAAIGAGVGAGAGLLTADDGEGLSSAAKGGLVGAGVGAAGSLAAKHLGAFTPSPFAPVAPAKVK